MIVRALAAALIGGAVLCASISSGRPASGSAPADQYFGLLKISYLEIENRFVDAAIRAGDHTVEPSVYATADFAADALEDWAKAYPRDPQLPRALYLGARAYAKVWLRVYQERAFGYLQRIVRDYPNTYFGRLVRRQLAIGFTEHYYAEPQPCAPADLAESASQPTSVPVPREVGPGRPKVQVEPAPCMTPPPTPEPSPTPTTTPTPTP